MPQSIAQQAVKIFKEAVVQYHVKDDIDQPFYNPHEEGTLSFLLYRKNWIDTVQWHYEDLIRDPNIDPVSGMALKRKIDASNQDRTDMVEYIDSYFLTSYQDVEVSPEATINSESPAWALDRLSILALKIYHMAEEANRSSASQAHRTQCQQKLAVLLTQQEDLCTAIDQLIEDIANGKKYMKVYKQMKMYNDDSLNPVLYSGNPQN
ncbi:MAG: DUF4254 domain-containing protein [Flavobacteriaceae bacterium]